jgi:NAD(P)-dependent dehydrogenase (short-subunit alcohol dehydrogenase family)
VSVLKLDLASLKSIRSFTEAFSTAGLPPLFAIVCNAGLQTVGPATYTEDGFETTFGVNHLGHFLLVNRLLSQLAGPGRIVFVSSGTHDPAQKSGMPEPVFTSAERLAHPVETDPGAASGVTGRLRYTTSKLCNVYCAYEPSRRIKTGTIRAITVNAFDSGLMPGTGLARNYPPLARLGWKYILPVLTLFQPNVNTVSKSGKALAALVTEPQYAGITAGYFEGTRQIKSSVLSYDAKNALDLWLGSAELVGLLPGETPLPL